MTTNSDNRAPTGDGAAGVSPEEALDHVRTLLRRELRLPDAVSLGENARLDLLPGADSVRLMRIVAVLEESYSVEFDDDAIRAADSIGDLVALVVSTVREIPGRP